MIGKQRAKVSHKGIWELAPQVSHYTLHLEGDGINHAQRLESPDQNWNHGGLVCQEAEPYRKCSCCQNHQHKWRCGGMDKMLLTSP